MFKLRNLKEIKGGLLFISSMLITILALNLYSSHDKSEVLSIEVNLLEFENELMVAENKENNDIIVEKEFKITVLEVEMQEMKGELARINDELKDFRDINRVVVANHKNITEKSNVSERQLSLILEGTELEGLEKAYILAENTYNINAIHLLSLTALESAWGESRLAVDKNNISGFQAYDKNPYNDAKYFESKDECIMVTARILSENYVGKDLISLKQINSKYASDSQWHSKIAVISKVIINNIN